ncbi:MAG: CAAD domain-containing protein [Stigonema ocellatum SAG 48.90 = DSM 106950]|nr:CAAD domain-containing protein [Stigonema ocellatum SAG 48.90 = DSM 106950]
MGTEEQQSQSVDTTLTEPIAALEGSKLGTQPLLPPAKEPLPQWQQIGGKILEFLEQLPEYLGTFFNQYRQPIISIALIIAAIVTFKLVLAVLDAINDIPQVQLVFELIGIGYVTWFIFRYLLKGSSRQELGAQIRSIQKDILDGQDS